MPFDIDMGCILVCFLAPLSNFEGVRIKDDFFIRYFQLFLWILHQQWIPKCAQIRDRVLPGGGSCPRRDLEHQFDHFLNDLSLCLTAPLDPAPPKQPPNCERHTIYIKYIKYTRYIKYIKSTKYTNITKYELCNLYI